jgi:hypothetical protein
VERHCSTEQSSSEPFDVATAEVTGRTDEETTLVVGLLTFAGAGWHTTGDALLADTSAAMARAGEDAAREEIAHKIGSTINARTDRAA